jgi:isopentenyl diphosphate isomerase/L-lactate dehydrogenase-like FMN-dependent dehydrogenase
MSQPPDHFSRRRFLAFLAGSPLFAAAGADLSRLSRLIHGSHRDQWEALDLVQQAAQDAPLIASPAEALNVFDFEAVARRKLPPAHWGYMATGSDDDGTIRANREGFNRYELRMRRLVDVSKTTAATEVLGTRWETPIILCPVGSQKAFHPEGEIAVARAAKAKGHLQVLSTVATSSIEDVTAARGAPIWFQLYHRTDWNQTRQMIRRADAAGCPAIVLTVDLLGGSNRETMRREALRDARQCIDCHAGGQPAPGRSGLVDDRDNRRKPMLAEFAPGTPIPEVGTPTWEFVKRLKDTAKAKVFLKGIVTREDAELAMTNGVDGLFVSNHGGRAENSQRATINSLPEVVAGVRGRGTIVVDGGFRRGTDIFKALALGANAVGVGRPYIWGLASFGQEGVEAVLGILRRELELVMRQAGTTSVTRITKSSIVARAG